MNAALRYDMMPGLRFEHRSWKRDEPLPSIEDCLARRREGHPWSLSIMEPLLTKAPSPARCSAYCCYSRTIIFYHRPYISVPEYPSRWSNGTVHRGGKVFAQYDQIETRLGWDDVVSFDGDTFAVEGGKVSWHHGRWWMHLNARRQAQVRPIGGGA